MKVSQVHFPSVYNLDKAECNWTLNLFSNFFKLIKNYLKVKMIIHFFDERKVI